jgi:hypothetical protein
MYSRVCEYCKKEFETKWFVQKYCCRKCTNKAGTTAFRKNLKIKAVEYKGGKCVACGYNKSMSAMHFHHLDSNEKDFGISQDGNCKTWEQIREELDKCILLCANCHAEIHDLS